MLKRMQPAGVSDGIVGHVTEFDDAPIVLVALDHPHEGVISAYRDGEPSFVWVNGIGDAIMAAHARGVDLIVPAHIYSELGDEFPPDLPGYIQIR
jgi:hypothetical protein